jgi:hypothetical protein
MNDLDSKTWMEAARRFARLRRRYGWFFLGGILVMAILGAPLFAFGETMNPALSGILNVAVTAGFILCWSGAALAFLARVRFRCPRCGNRFIVSGRGTWPTRRCKHCDLDLRPASIATP